MGRGVGVAEFHLSTLFAVISCLIGFLFLAPTASAQDLGEPEPLPMNSYGPVGPKETLWSIAKSLGREVPGASTAQIAWGLYRANPEAFEGAPGRLRPRVTLKIPDSAFIKAASPAESYAFVTGTRPPATTAAAAPRPATPPPALPPAAPPGIAGVELLPVMGRETRQDFAVVGTGFKPGATLEFVNLSSKKTAARRKPAALTATRIEYAANFGKQASRWQVAVRNPDGRMSAPYEFEGGADVTLVLNPPPAAVVLNPELAALIQPGATASEPPSFRTSADAQSLPAEAKARYQRLASLEERYASDVDYDYLYGSSAYDSGHYSEAIFILQRAVSSRPGFSGARMELARAYYATGDNESARREFLTVREENPPPEARRVIAEYLDAIDRRAATYESQLGGYLEGSTGFDSNANGGPDSQTFLGFTLDSRNQATDSSYYGVGLGGSLSYPFAPEWRVLGDTRLQHRAYPDASFVDGEVARVGTGLEWRPGLVTLSLGPNFSYVRLDGEENHQNTGVDFSAGYAQSERWRLSLSTRYGMLRFVDALSVQDVDSLLVGLTSQYTWLSLPRAQLGVTVTAGQDSAKETTSSFGRDLLGARVSGSLDFNRSRVLFLALSSLNSDYDGTFFGMSRKDEQMSATLGLDWGVYRASGWLLRGQVSYVDNQSDIPLYDYQRMDAGLSLRKEFK